MGRVTYSPGGGFGPRRQLDLQLVILDSGSVRITTDGQTAELKPGQVVAQWPGGQESYVFDRHTESTHRWIALQFPGELAEHRWLEKRRRTSPGVRLETSSMNRWFGEAFSRKASGTESGDWLSRQLALAYVAAYFHEASDSGRAGRYSAHWPEPLMRVEAMLYERFPEALTLEDLAKAAAVTPSHLVRLSRKHTGDTPMQRLRRVRLDQAEQLLRQTGMSIGEIAYRVGFANPFHFSRLFKAQFGASPKAHRAQLWDRESHELRGG